MDEKPMEDVFDEKAGDADGDAKRSMRPTTARRRPPKVKDATREVTAKDVAPSAKKAIGIMKDGEEVEEDEDIVEERLADDKGTGDADRNQGQSKLVQDILSRQAEQEAAAKGSSREDDMKAKQDAEDKSGGIRLGRLRKTGAGDKKGGGITTGGGDVERLRKAVQILVQQTGPLGTCMDYIQEDVGIMMMELHRWEEECRKYEMEVEKQKKQTGDMMIPLRCELAGLEEQIREQKMHVSVTKASIAKNESRIQQILRLTATA
ncbi:Traf3ip1 [Symbiodinium microadriaticum]|nr:Traf3ip1 [Symbiodinium microadriaticum]